MLYPKPCYKEPCYKKVVVYVKSKARDELMKPHYVIRTFAIHRYILQYQMMHDHENGPYAICGQQALISLHICAG